MTPKPSPGGRLTLHCQNPVGYQEHLVTQGLTEEQAGRREPRGHRPPCAHRPPRPSGPATPRQPSPAARGQADFRKRRRKLPGGREPGEGFRWLAKCRLRFSACQILIRFTGQESLSLNSKVYTSCPESLLCQPQSYLPNFSPPGIYSDHLHQPSLRRAHKPSDPRGGGWVGSA